MRKRFDPQLKLDSTPIGEVVIDTKSRHQLAALLLGLQYIFNTVELHESIFNLLEKAVKSEKKNTGRLGMSLWEILVLGVIRLNLDIDYDNLQDLANNHLSVRGLLGHTTSSIFGRDKTYALQTIKDNVGLLNSDLLSEINDIVVGSGHDLKKKSEVKVSSAEGDEKDESSSLGLRLKTDTYVVESPIKFPTDYGLLWDSFRKSLDILTKILDNQSLSGSWRKHKSLRKQVKKCYRKVGNIHRKKGKDYEARLETSVLEYLGLCKKISSKLKLSITDLATQKNKNLSLLSLEKELHYYYLTLLKHMDLLNRRIILKEKIPHCEKIFSIFEPHVEWLSKGKAHKAVELGHAVSL